MSRPYTYVISRGCTSLRSSAPDTQLVADYVRHMVHQHSIERDGEAPEVRTVATLCKQLVYNNKGMNQGHGLSAAMICAGWDKHNGGQVGNAFSHPKP